MGDLGAGIAQVHVRYGTYVHANNTNEQDVLEFLVNTNEIKIALDVASISNPAVPR